MDNASGSRDGKDGGEKRGRKPGAKLGPNKKPREAKRGQGIAILEAMRIRGDMEMMLPGNHLSQQPPSCGTYGLVITQAWYLFHDLQIVVFSIYHHIYHVLCFLQIDLSNREEI
jgi:hypothetical protein